MIGDCFFCTINFALAYHDKIPPIWTLILQRISRSGQAEQTITKSRFIAVAEYCADERAVMLLLRRLAAEHTHAHHLVFAYQLHNPQGGALQRFHDAGEPSGTAGKPILQYIEGRDLVNACVAVVR